MEQTLIFFPDGTQINFKKEKLVQRSSKKFLEVSKNEAWKFQLLPNWLDNVSYWYTREDKETLPSRYIDGKIYGKRDMHCDIGHRYRTASRSEKTYYYI